VQTAAVKGRLALVVLALLAAACGGDDTEAVRLNEIQQIGTHNSYHQRVSPALTEALRGFDAAFADSVDYAHRPLDEQLDAGVRHFEIDVFADPSGGHYAERGTNPILGLDRATGIPELSEPGFKVLHIQDVDYESSCLTFVECLSVVAAWSADHPDHLPILLLVEAKDGTIPDPGLGFAVPLEIGSAELDALDAEIRSVFDDSQLLTPDDVRGDHDTLDSAVTTDGWPTLEASRGKVLFGLINDDETMDAYLADHPSLEGRVLFTSSAPGSPSAAFVKVDDPVAEGDRITDLVRRGYLVRTRADADTVQARSGDTEMRDAAFASGAQFVSTDYIEDDPVFPATFEVRFPGGGLARCNPVLTPPDCEDGDLQP
jgi:hypothetical protein